MSEVEQVKIITSHKGPCAHVKIINEEECNQASELGFFFTEIETAIYHGK
jgi:hypothetical protein